MANLADMINTRQLDFEFFLKMHPFSASNKNVYDDALESIDFFEELHIKTVEMYARLSEISNVLSTGLKNLVIITGYRGCGKTNFLRYIEYLANGGEINQTLQETYKHQLRCADDAISFKKQYRETKNAIYITLQGAVDEEHIEGKVLNRHIEKSIRSEPTYLNFDIGGFHKEKPLSTKIYYLLEGAITDCISDGTIRGIVRIIMYVIFDCKSRYLSGPCDIDKNLMIFLIEYLAEERQEISPVTDRIFIIPDHQL